jgi:hypothetical protein
VMAAEARAWETAQVARLTWYLTLSGLTPQSIDSLRSDLPRWATHLRKAGCTPVPDLRCHASWSRDEIRTSNIINLQLQQAAHNQSAAHALRNLTRVRPFKA